MKKKKLSKKDIPTLQAGLKGYDTVIVVRNVAIDRRVAHGLLQELEALEDGKTLTIAYETWQRVG